MCGWGGVEEKIVGRLFLQRFACLAASYHTGLCSGVTCSEPSQASLPNKVPSHTLLAYLSTFCGLFPHWSVSSIIARICVVYCCELSTWLMVYTANKYEGDWVILFQTGSHLSPDSEAFRQQKWGEQFGSPFPDVFLYLTGDVFFSHRKSPGNTVHLVSFSLLPARFHSCQNQR